jgi:hypothetical protein
MSGQNSFALFLARGRGFHNNALLAMEYDQHSDTHDRLNSANNFGFCLEHELSGEKNMELARKH